MPLPVLSIAQMRDWEKATWAAGQTEAEVIRQVGEQVAALALELTGPGEQVLLLAGKGNNGADARAAKGLLKDRRVDLLEVKDPAADRLKLQGLLSLRPRLIIDGLFGVGINRALSPEWVQFIQGVNESHGRVLAVDVPSDLNADNGQPEGAAIEAFVTLTVGAPKAGLLQESAWPYVGRLEVADHVGLVPWQAASEAQWTMPADFQDFPPRRAAATHKGSYGHLAILAGSLGYHGASVLAARGAQRAQPGLITLYCLETVYQVVAPHLQAVMVAPWRTDWQLPRTGSAVLAGPGLAAADVPEQMKAFVRQLWRDSPLPVIVDASALDWLPSGETPTDAVRVITPHPGEAARLLGGTTASVQSNRLAAVRKLSKKFGNTWVVLKGHQTLVGRSEGPVFVNCSGNPHLAQGGSGDVLSGYLSGLLAQPRLAQHALTTLRFGVWQHGAAADRLQCAQGNWVVEDLIAGLGNVTQGMNCCD